MSILEWTSTIMFIMFGFISVTKYIFKKAKGGKEYKTILMPLKKYDESKISWKLWKQGWSGEKIKKYLEALKRMDRGEKEDE